MKAEWMDEDDKAENEEEGKAEVGNNKMRQIPVQSFA
jgi:hypothetical protein